MRFLILALIFIAFPASAAERRFAVADFDRVIVEGPYSVRLTVGAPSSAVASGSAVALDAVSVEVRGTTLRIRRNVNAWGSAPGRPVEPAVIALTTRNLRSAQVIGTGMLHVAGARGLRLELAADGSSHLIAERLAVDNLALALRGSGTITASGTAKALTALVQGSGSLNATALVADAATLSAATSGEIGLNVRRTATVTANGLGRVTIAGSPACTLDGPGAANVSCGSGR